MYILHHSFKNLGRNKGRNILMAIIILTIIASSAISFIINSTTDAIIKDYKNRFSSEVSIAYDWDNMTEEMNAAYSKPSNQKLIAFGNSDLLSKSEFFGEINVNLRSLKTLDDGTGMSYALVFGSSLKDIDDNFKCGNRRIEQGRMYEAINECLISKELAALNNLSVGDIIKADSILADNFTHQLVISGIYTDYTDYTEETIRNNKGNEIIVGIHTAVNMKMFNRNGYLKATYFLKNPSLLEDYHKELIKKGLPAYYKLAADEAGYKKVVGPVEGLAKFAHYFVILVLGVGVMILVLLSALAIRERKYEIGVLRTMGMKKRKVALGSLLEILMITISCLAAGLCLGTALAQPVADTLLESQIKIAHENTRKYQSPYIITNSNDEMINHYVSPLSPSSLEPLPLSELHVSLTFPIIIKIILTAVLLASVSSFTGIYYITKHEPAIILSERN